MFWRLLLLLRRLLAVVCGGVIGLTKLPFPASDIRLVSPDAGRLLGSNPERTESREV